MESISYQPSEAEDDTWSYYGYVMGSL